MNFGTIFSHRSGGLCLILWTSLDFVLDRGWEGSVIVRASLCFYGRWVGERWFLRVCVCWVRFWIDRVGSGRQVFVGFWNSLCEDLGSISWKKSFGVVFVG
ncbi:hypothetical protein KC19_9G039500 [Ceratodon purpureus]|uniref:Transmembrane protein n=1 Tax=Ceratodon purpureus TaxID=3225 RepID=A0A8T0GNI0_CERPU|nr:hypothetical protein KC19_9G039500 [Ceratodon purpureus]